MTANDLRSIKAAEEREPAGRSGKTGGNEDFSSILAQLTGVDGKGTDLKTGAPRKSAEGSQEDGASRKVNMSKNTREQGKAVESGASEMKARKGTGMKNRKPSVTRQSIIGKLAVLGAPGRKTGDKRPFKAQSGSEEIAADLRKRVSWSGGKMQMRGRRPQRKAAAALVVGKRKNGTLRQVTHASQKKLEHTTHAYSRHSKQVPIKIPKGGAEVTRLSAVKRAPETREAPRTPGIERDRITGGPEKAAVERLPDAVLTRYEDSMKSVEIKSNYQNLKNADGNFDEIVRQFTLLLKNGGGEARLVLQPEHLGNLRLRIQLDRGEVATSIIVDNQAVKDLILSRLNILEESLLRHGFGLGSFEVGVKGENAEGDKSSAKAQTRRSVRIPGSAVEDEGLNVPMPEQYLPWISSRVNIRI